ncbi:hypothetical protein [Microbispora sp. NPDC049633]|uniref:hypothetical protein n=1 Tax=Microbispora sp. NPDC049633 TaxID=3154355 RepID=UPI0034186E26
MISEDPARRRRALQYLQGSDERRAKALAEFNEVWQHGESAGSEVLFRWCAERDRRLPDALWEYVPVESYAQWGGLKYLLLYLEWESRYPDEWMANAKSWGTKGGGLRDLTRALPYLPDEIVDQLARLVSLAVRREHRVEDMRYAILARAVGGGRLRPLLAEIAGDGHEKIRLRARYLLWLLDHPELPTPKSSQWVAWLKSQG